MKYPLAAMLLALTVSIGATGQFSRYLVKFKDKAGTPYTFSNPIAYLSQRAIDRRNRYGISIDSTDLPVNPSYVTQIRNVANVTILNISKWLNAVTIQTNDPKLRRFVLYSAELPGQIRVAKIIEIEI